MLVRALQLLQFKMGGTKVYLQLVDTFNKDGRVEWTRANSISLFFLFLSHFHSVGNTLFQTDIVKIEKWFSSWFRPQTTFWKFFPIKKILEFRYRFHRNVILSINRADSFMDYKCLKTFLKRFFSFVFFSNGFFF